MHSPLPAALAWAARGFRVFPILPGDKVPPKGLRWSAEATTDAGKIRAWWQFNPSYNYGVACGGGLLVVDVDRRNDGFGSLVALDIPDDTLTVRTPGGGLHLYFTGPDVQNSVNKLAPGIDIRSAGGYVVGPGSHFTDPGGKKGYSGPYTIEHDGPAVTAPELLLLACGQPKARETGPALSIDDPDDIVFALHYLLKDAPAAIEGRGGNNTTYAVAARLVEIGLSAGKAVELMREHWNPRCQPPWAADELAQIVGNAAQYAQERQGSGGLTAIREEFSGAVVIEEPPVSDGYAKVFAPRAPTPLELIPVEQWIVHRLLMRDEAAILAGPGAAGKSTFAITLAVHGAAGISLGNYHIPRPFKTVVYNFEDDRHTMEAKVYAACATYNLDPAIVFPKILLWPGREQRFRVMRKDGTWAMADIREVARLVVGGGFDVMVLDPLVSLHGEDENDNVAMGEVMEAVNGLARLAKAAVLALHHTSKGQRQAGSADAVRGAGNIVNAVRLAATLYPADDADATVYGLGPEARAVYARLDDAKVNAARTELKPTWLQRQNFPLPSGRNVYSFNLAEIAASVKGEAQLMASILASYMDRVGSIHLFTHDAARVLVEQEVMYREQVPQSGDLRQIKHKIEMRLAAPGVILENGVRVVVKTLSTPGAATTRSAVTLEV